MARYLLPPDGDAIRLEAWQGRQAVKDREDNERIVGPDNVRRIARLGLSKSKLRKMAREEAKHVRWLREQGLTFQAEHCAARMTAMRLAAEEVH